MNISKNALKTVYTMSAVFGLTSFVKYNGIERAVTTVYSNSSVQQIVEMQASVFPPLPILKEAILFLLSLCLIGFVALIIFVEIMVRFLQAMGWKDNGVYRFLSHKDCK
jgi:ABC-type polysaccharide/polyol phosphate export permease